jgi:hypothetical protein
VTHQVRLEVEIIDPELLRAVALRWAKQSGMTENEFRHVEETYYPGDFESYWLRWVASKMSVLPCGITVEDYLAERMSVLPCWITVEDSGDS